MTKEEILTQIAKLQRRWNYHAIEHRVKRENNNPQYNAYDHGVATGYLKALNTFKDWTMRLKKKQCVELTWEDIMTINALLQDVSDKKCTVGLKEYYEEVLRRFNELKEKHNGM